MTVESAVVVLGPAVPVLGPAVAVLMAVEEVVKTAVVVDIASTSIVEVEVLEVQGDISAEAGVSFICGCCCLYIK